MIRRMSGRLAAACGWLAWQMRRPFGGTSSRIARLAPVALGVVLLLVAVSPIAVPLLNAQPQDVTVQNVFDGAVDDPAGWVRLRGRIARLTESPTGVAGHYALFVDAANPLRAIVITAADRPEASEEAILTGHLVAAGVAVEEEIPQEATVFGAPPRIVPDRVVELDEAPKPERVVLWPLSILPALLGVALLIGAAVGYPIFRPTSEVDVLTAPLGPGERLPAAFGGRVGPNVRDLADPGGALLLVRHGPKGNILTAQPLADDGGVAPQPVTIGGGWTSGRIGYVHTVSESVPALTIRSEVVDAIFLFARTSERDRVAALVSVER